jgi:hypothetical protein
VFSRAQKNITFKYLKHLKKHTVVFFFFTEGDSFTHVNLNRCLGLCISSEKYEDIMPKERPAKPLQHTTSSNIGSVIIPLKPKRPLTCYGIFSVLERNIIWQKDQKQTPTSSKEFFESADASYAALRPERYRHLVLPVDWYVVGMNRKKRNDHINHGMISFNDLSKAIADKWKTVDAETKAYCELIANSEHHRYEIELAAYIDTYGEDAVKAQVQSKKSLARA